MSIKPSFITSHFLCDQSFEQFTCDVWPLVAARLRKRLWVPMVLDSLRFDLFVGLRTRDRTIVFDCGAASLNILWAYVEDVHKKLEASWRIRQTSWYHLFSLACHRLQSASSMAQRIRFSFHPASMPMQVSLRWAQYSWDTFRIKAVTKTIVVKDGNNAKIDFWTTDLRLCPRSTGSKWF